MATLKLKNSLKLKQFIAVVVKDVEDEIKKLENWQDLKYDHELIKSVSDLIDKKVMDGSVQNYKIDKQSLLMTVLCSVFNLNDEEKKAVEATVEFLVENKLILAWTFKKGFQMLFKKLHF